MAGSGGIAVRMTIAGLWRGMGVCEPSAQATSIDVGARSSYPSGKGLARHRPHGANHAGAYSPQNDGTREVPCPSSMPSMQHLDAQC